MKLSVITKAVLPLIFSSQISAIEAEATNLARRTLGKRQVTPEVTTKVHVEINGQEVPADSLPGLTTLGTQIGRKCPPWQRVLNNVWDSLGLGSSPPELQNSDLEYFPAAAKRVTRPAQEQVTEDTVQEPEPVTENPVQEEPPVIEEYSTEPVTQNPAPAPVPELPILLQKLIECHNNFRSDVRIRPLTWDASLANDATRWSEHLAFNVGDLVHAEPSQRSGNGENLYFYSGSDLSQENVAKNACDKWGFKQREDYEADGEPEFGHHNTHMWTHYTQIVWANTDRFGCGYAPNSNSNRVYVTCRFAPAGNWLGEFPYPQKRNPKN